MFPPPIPRIFRAGLAFSLLALLSACRSPKPSQPLNLPSVGAPLPQRFSAIGGTEAAPRWWEEWGDPALNALMERVLSENFSLSAARERLRQSLALVAQSGSAKRPELNLTAGAETRRTEGDDTGASSTRNYALGMAASYELDLWGRLDAADAARRMDAAATRETLDATAMSLAAETAVTWMNLAWRQEEAEVLRRQLRAGTSALDWLTMRFERGQARAADVLQQEEALESIKAAQEQNRGQQELLRQRLALLAGAPMDAFPMPAVNLPPLPPRPAPGVPLDVLNRRPDVRAQWYRLQAADLDLAEAVANRRPRLTLTARISSTATSPSRLLEDWLASLAAEFIAPLVDGGERKARVEAADALRSQRLAETAQVLLQAVAEVEGALTREDSEQKVYARRFVQETLAGQALERIQASYQNGGVDFLRWINAQQNFHNAQLRSLNSRAQQWSYRIDLLRATAGGLNLPSDPETHHAKR